MMVTDTLGKKLCRDDVPVPSTVLSGTGQWDTWGSPFPEPLARRRWGWGHRTNPAFATHVWTHHSKSRPQDTASLVWAVGGKAPGAHHTQNAVEDPAVEPCPQGLHAQGQMRDAHGYKAFPMAAGSREPDFGSQSTNEQHSQMKGPQSCACLTPSLCGEQGRSRGFPRMGCFALCWSYS